MDSKKLYKKYAGSQVNSRKRVPMIICGYKTDDLLLIGAYLPNSKGEHGWSSDMRSPYDILWGWFNNPEGYEYITIDKAKEQLRRQSPFSKLLRWIKKAF